MVSAHVSSQCKVTTTTVGGDDGKVPLPLRMLRDGWQLVRAIRRTRPDVIHLNPSLDRAIVRDGLYLLLARLVHRGPLVVFIHGWTDGYEEKISRSALLVWLFRFVFGPASQVYVLAAKFRDRLIAWGLDPARIRATSTMYDAAQFEGLQRRRPVPAQPNELQLLFMSRLVPRKGALESLEAFAKLSDAEPGIRFVCAGDGPARPALEAAAKALQHDGGVHFPGFVRGAEKAQLLLDSDIFVFPTYYGEGCPVSLLEAMAAGLPVLTADAGGIADLFDTGAKGILLAARPDAAAVAAALRSMSRDVDELRRMGLENQALASTRFEARAWCRTLEADYAGLIERAG